METQAVHTPVHTPGPWMWDRYVLVPAEPDPDRHAIHTILIAEHQGFGFVGSKLPDALAENDANMALLAAAPQLLDAARAAEAVLGRQGWLASSTDPEAVALSKLRAAIATATTVERA
ncbi:hypothetical protein E6C76_20315 [Pseudothauera nasutitermitis]|uniref:Uncharacterized protein n=1 Tax=Pseudothauera nasutitermitis TaxID=2565930 RepID=A0A4S4AP38_9RHOO|nr:hypothetical protein [Pseudothauera nasutitermitis]THF61428.1 hypothetical protein E6C76_20315 [Pseudothauera nasutitermitis]